MPLPSSSPIDHDVDSSSPSIRNTRDQQRTPSDDSSIDDDLSPSHLIPLDPPDDATSASINDNSRVIPASIVKPTSTLVSLTSTLSNFGSQAASQWQSLRVTSSSHNNISNTLQPPIASPAASPSIPPLDLNSDPSPSLEPLDARDPYSIATRITSEPDASASQLDRVAEQVAWAGWDRLPARRSKSSKASDASVLVLLVAYAHRGWAMYASDGDDFRELLSVREVVLQDGTAAGRVLCAALAPPNTDGHLCALLVTECLTDGGDGDSGSISVSRVSLDSHSTLVTSVLEVLPSEGCSAAPLAASMRISSRFLAISQNKPPAIHLLNTGTLTAVQPALTDVAPAGDRAERPPALDLSGRLLAYATTQLPSRSNIICATAATSRHGDTSGRARSHTASDQQFATQMRLNAVQTSAQVGDAARRVSGTVMHGVRSISAYLGAVPPDGPASQSASSPPQSRQPFSRSAPQPSPDFMRPRGSSLAGSPSVRPVNKRASLDKAAFDVAPPASPLGVRTHSWLPAAAVRVVDLAASQPRTLAHFLPALQPHLTLSSLAAVSLAPSGTPLVFTADASGHSFNVWEMRVRGRAASRDADVHSSLPPAVWHRYKLFRGLTSAEVTSVRWSRIGQWLGVGTSKGTIHFFALNPFGDSPDIAAHMAGQVRSPTKIPPLSVVLDATARSSRVVKAQETAAGGVAKQASLSAIPPAIVMLDCTPARRAASGSQLAFTSDISGGHPVLDAFVFDPAAATLALHRLVCSTRKTARDNAPPDADKLSPASSPPLSSPPGSRISGLTHMMRTTGGSLAGRAHASLASAGGPSMSSHPDHLTAAAACIAIWREVVSAQGSSDVKGSFSRVGPSSSPLISGHLRPGAVCVALAEIETYCRAPRVLPPSVYLSSQFRFLAFWNAEGAALRPTPVLSSLRHAGARRIELREEARLLSRYDGEQQVDDSGPESFEDSLASAIGRRAFDSSSPLSSASSPSSLIPMWPQGKPARRPSRWSAVAHGIPIRTVTEAVGGRLERARQDFSRAQHGRARRSERGSTPLSFDGADDADALFAAARTTSISGDSGFSASLSPTRAGYGSMASGSAETALTEGSSGEGCLHDDGKPDVFELDDEIEERDELTWAAARGLGKDLEGDEAGWDSFADAEFGGNGMRKLGDARRQGTSSSEDFIGGVFDEDAGAGTMGRTSAGGLEATSPLPDVLPRQLAYRQVGRASHSTGTSLGSTVSSLRGASAMSAAEAVLGTSPGQSSSGAGSDEGASVSGREDGSKTSRKSRKIPGALPRKKGALER